MFKLVQMQAHVHVHVMINILFLVWYVKYWMMCYYCVTSVTFHNSLFYCIRKPIQNSQSVMVLMVICGNHSIRFPLPLTNMVTLYFEFSVLQIKHLCILIIKASQHVGYHCWCICMSPFKLIQKPFEVWCPKLTSLLNVLSVCERLQSNPTV